MPRQKSPTPREVAEPIEESTSRAVANWQEELAKEARIAAEMEANTGGGKMFTVKNGILSFNDSPIPGNSMTVIVLDHILENVYYEGPYDPDNPSPPTCFALGRSDKGMKPHEKVVEAGQAQHDDCAGCPMNQWASASTGRGKACKNTRRLAIIGAGTQDAKGVFRPYKEADLEVSPVGYMKLPVTSTVGWATFVKQVAGALQRPPYGVYTRISVVPDVKTQFKINFEPVSNVPDELIGLVMRRNREAQSTIDFPYELQSGEESSSRKTAASKARPSPKAAANKYTRKAR